MLEIKSVVTDKKTIVGSKIVAEDHPLFQRHQSCSCGGGIQEHSILSPDMNPNPNPNPTTQRDMDSDWYQLESNQEAF